MVFLWTSRGKGYNVSSTGDRRFSALYAILSDGRCIEAHYQCDVKGYDPGGMGLEEGEREASVTAYDPRGAL